MKEKGKVRNWLIEKKNKFLDFCHENPEAIDVIGSVATVVGGMLTLTAALVKAGNDKKNRELEDKKENDD